MIKLYVDDSYAFEYYCIMLVKKEFLGNGKIDEQISECEKYIIEQIGFEKFQLIRNSIEFKNMFKVNCDTFKAVDLAKENKLKASEVDNCSFMRKKAKDALQSAFFENDNFENKTGYREQ